MEGGRIQYSGSAKELRDDPSRLHSAYLLRTVAGDSIPAPTESLPAGG
jgi:branched-chain amino acid transport system ATP-binding protein